MAGGESREDQAAGWSLKAVRGSMDQLTIGPMSSCRRLITSTPSLCRTYDWAVLIGCGLGALVLVLRKVPIVLRECRKVAAAYYDLLDEVDRRRRARIARRQPGEE